VEAVEADSITTEGPNVGYKLIGLALVVLASGTAAMADTFGTGKDRFTIDFVPICSGTKPGSGCGIVSHPYRMGTYEITNDQWNKFQASLGVPVTGSDGGYGAGFYDWGTGTTNVPANGVSWYEAAQFVNWLNTSTDHQVAYNFTGTQGTSDYTFATWGPTEAGYDASNPYRNKNAYYFLPTEDEWATAADWNGTTLQTWATKDGGVPAQGNGTSGTGWNYYNNGCATTPHGPWNVGSGSRELNGTYDMMGNVWEWTEGQSWTGGDYETGPSLGLRRGSFYFSVSYLLSSSNRDPYSGPSSEGTSVGFRVASVPEPGSIALLLAGAIAGWMCWRRWR
jgi:formylglycine-generating enzyme required for sulfatase activity